MIAGRLRFILLVSAAGAGFAAPATASAQVSEVPRASDFTRALPEATQLREPSARAQRTADRRKGYGVEGPILYRTPPVSSPRRFDIVGVAGEMHAMEYRARTEGGEWSDWVEADNGDPVHTGGTDVVQVRSRTVPITGELQFVSVHGGTAPESEPPESEPAPLLRGKPGKRLAPKPKIISRAQWGANSRKRGCLPREAPEFGRVKAGVIHHTVSTNTYTEAEAPGVVLGICRFHRDGNGWNDIGYNALVDRFGNVYEGRAGGLNKPIIGAQAEGHNSQTTGVATIANHQEVAATGAERKALINYLAWRLGAARISAAGKTTLTSSGGASTRTPRGQKVRLPRIFSHSDTNFTECAGTKLRAEVPKIRRAVQNRMDAFGDGEIDPTDPDDPTHPPADPIGGGTTP